LADPELEVRWEKITDLVGVMRRRGEEAVLRGREEVRVGTRVLGWTEMQGVEGVSHEGGGGEEGERDVAEG